MTEYIHELPGRLRVRCRSLRKNELKAAAVKGELSAVRGVRSVAVNPLTGSVTVSYDASRTTAPALMGLLRAQGCLDAGLSTSATVRQATPAPMGRRRADNRQTSSIAKAVAGFVVEKAIERSLMALVAAVL